MSKLNPCPLCGSEPDIESNGGYTSVYCVLCVDGFTITSESASGAINAWNAATSDGAANQSGKTLRDEFAMAVLNGAIAANSNCRPVSYDDLAADCYGVADAMIKERSK